MNNPEIEERNNRTLSEMVEVTLSKPDSFLIVKETLTRIGVPSTQTKTLSQSCHILHKRGKYYIAHFKLLFELDGKSSNFDNDDRDRMVAIANLLQTWGLVSVIKSREIENLEVVKKIKIIPSSEKPKWKLVSKHRIGTNKL